MTFCCGGAVSTGAACAVSPAAGLDAEFGSSSESSESLESLLAVEIPPKSAAAAFAFFLSALLSTGAGLLGLDVVVVVDPPILLAGWLIDVLLLATGSGYLVSSTGAAPQTFLTPVTAKEAYPAPLACTRPGAIPVTLNGAASPVFVLAAAPPALARINGLDYCND